MSRGAAKLEWLELEAGADAGGADLGGNVSDRRELNELIFAAHKDILA